MSNNYTPLLQRKEFAETQAWTHTYPGSKRPYQKTTTPSDQLYTLPQLLSLPTHDTINIGFITASWNPFIIVDVDHSLVIPSLFVSLPTYTELSLSQKGLHLVYRMPPNTPKPPVKILKARANQDWQGQIAIANNFMVMTGKVLASAEQMFDTGKVLASAEQMFDTGKVLASASPDIHTLTPEELNMIISEMQGQSSPVSINSQSVISDEQPPMVITSTVKDEVTSETQTTIQEQPQEITAFQQQTNLYKIKQLKSLVLSLPIDQNFMIKQAYEKVTGNTYCHYDYWLMVGMAIYNETVKLNEYKRGLDLYIKWSSQDPTSYTSEEEVAAKFVSFRNMPNPHYTIATLRAIYSHCTFNFKMTGRKGNKIDTTNEDNIQEALNKLQLKFFNSPYVGIFLSGPDSLLSKYSLATKNKMLDFYGPFSAKGSLETLLTNILQNECNWPGNEWSTRVIRSALGYAEPMNPVTYWLRKSPEDLLAQCTDPRHKDNLDNDNPSTFEDFWACFKLPYNVDPAPHKNKLYRWLMQALKMADPQNQDALNAGMLILAGPENTGKTTFFRELFPPLLKRFVLESMENLDSAKEVRDMRRSLIGNILVYFDECDTVFKNQVANSTVKKIVTSTNVSFVDIFETSSTSGIRTAIIGGTTNIMELQLDATSSRRLWVIPVEDIDMNAMRKISRYRLFKSLQAEYREKMAHGEMPWVMTYEESKQITQSNTEFRSFSNLSILLHDLFEWPEKPKTMSQSNITYLAKSPTRAATNKHPNLYKMQFITALLRANYSEYDLRIQVAQLRQELKKLAIEYTGNQTSFNLNDKWEYCCGLVQSIANRRGCSASYLLPPLREGIINPFASEDEAEDLNDNTNELDNSNNKLNNSNK